MKNVFFSAFFTFKMRRMFFAFKKKIDNSHLNILSISMFKWEYSPRVAHASKVEDGGRIWKTIQQLDLLSLIWFRLFLSIFSTFPDSDEIKDLARNTFTHKKALFWISYSALGKTFTFLVIAQEL